MTENGETGYENAGPSVVHVDDADEDGYRRRPHRIAASLATTLKAVEPDDLRCLAIERDAGRQQSDRQVNVEPGACVAVNGVCVRSDPGCGRSRSPAPTFVSIADVAGLDKCRVVVVGMHHADDDARRRHQR